MSSATQTALQDRRSPTNILNAVARRNYAKLNKARKTMWLPGNSISETSVLGSGLDARARSWPTELVSSSRRFKSSVDFSAC